MSDEKMIVGNKFAHFDGMVWPLPAVREDDVSWKLRYMPQTLTRADELYCASIIEAYSQMIFDPIKKRQGVIKKIRKALK